MRIKPAIAELYPYKAREFIMTHLINYASSSFVVHMSSIIGTVVPPFCEGEEG